MAEKKYIVAVVGIIKKNGQLANAGDEVSSDDFNNFDDKLNGGYVKEKADYAKAKEQSDADRLAAVEQKRRDGFIIAYKKAFNIDAPADASTDDIKNAIKDEKAISVADDLGDKGADDKKELKKLI